MEISDKTVKAAIIAQQAAIRHSDQSPVWPQDWRDDELMTNNAELTEGNNGHR